MCIYKLSYHTVKLSWFRIKCYFISQYLKKQYLFDRYSHNSFSNRAECFNFMDAVTTICGNLLVFMPCCRKWWLKLVKFKNIIYYITVNINSTDYIKLWQLYDFNCWIQEGQDLWGRTGLVNQILHNILSKISNNSLSIKWNLYLKCFTKT